MKRLQIIRIFMRVALFDTQQSLALRNIVHIVPVALYRMKYSTINICSALANVPSWNGTEAKAPFYVAGIAAIIVD